MSRYDVFIDGTDDAVRYCVASICMHKFVCLCYDDVRVVKHNGMAMSMSLFRGEYVEHMS